MKLLKMGVVVLFLVFIALIVAAHYFAQSEYSLAQWNSNLNSVGVQPYSQVPEVLADQVLIGECGVSTSHITSLSWNCKLLDGPLKRGVHNFRCPYDDPVNIDPAWDLLTSSAEVKAFVRSKFEGQSLIETVNWLECQGTAVSIQGAVSKSEKNVPSRISVTLYDIHNVKLRPFSGKWKICDSNSSLLAVLASNIGVCIGYPYFDVQFELDTSGRIVSQH